MLLHLILVKKSQNNCIFLLLMKEVLGCDAWSSLLDLWFSDIAAELEWESQRTLEVASPKEMWEILKVILK